MPLRMILEHTEDFVVWLLAFQMRQTPAPCWCRRCRLRVYHPLRHPPIPSLLWLVVVKASGLNPSRNPWRPRRDLNPCYRRERPVS